MSARIAPSGVRRVMRWVLESTAILYVMPAKAGIQ
jgi:hypothetical protein